MSSNYSAQEMTCRFQIRLDTERSVAKLVSIATSYDADVVIKVLDDSGNIVNAKSLMGMLYAFTFENIWLESNCDVYNAFREFAID